MCEVDYVKTPACALGGCQCFLRVTEAGDLSLVAPGGDITIPAFAVARSAILSDLKVSHGPGSLLPLPFGLEGFVFWLASACRWAEAQWMHRGQQMPADHLVHALTVCLHSHSCLSYAVRSAAVVCSCHRERLVSNARKEPVSKGLSSTNNTHSPRTALRLCSSSYTAQAPLQHDVDVFARG